MTHAVTSSLPVLAPVPDPTTNQLPVITPLADVLEKLARVLRDGETLELPPITDLRVLMSADGKAVIVARLDREDVYIWARAMTRPRVAVNGVEIAFSGRYAGLDWRIQSHRFVPVHPARRDTHTWPPSPFPRQVARTGARLVAV